MEFSKNWRNWLASIDEKTCRECRRRHGKIYSKKERISPRPPIHPYCRCLIVPMFSVEAGTLTPYGVEGADWYVKYLKQLSDNYLTKYDAAQMGWERYKGNLADVLPGYQIFGGRYYNDDGDFPQKEGRLWYEADINYTGGYRSAQRLVFSNDGLIFYTYDHYETFIEVE